MCRGHFFDRHSWPITSMAACPCRPELFWWQLGLRIPLSNFLRLLVGLGCFHPPFLPSFLHLGSDLHLWSLSSPPFCCLPWSGWHCPGRVRRLRWGEPSSKEKLWGKGPGQSHVSSLLSAGGGKVKHEELTIYSRKGPRWEFCPSFKNSRTTLANSTLFQDWVPKGSGTWRK